jgi:DnaJ-class molecular chaperone
MNEYYELLGLQETATDEEITARYSELTEKYREERWQDGEAGNEAARMLTKLETAYREIMASRKEQEKNTEGQNSFEEISALLKENKIAEAQSRLDDFNERSAEWHYLQAAVYYKKNWTNDSKKQLEIAMQMDPNNQKYRAAYGKLNAKNDYQQQQAHQQPQNPYANGHYDEQMGGGSACSNCVSCCYTYLCVDCLFSLCCGCR